MGTLGCWAAGAASVTAAHTAPFTVTVTLNPDSAFAGQEPPGCDANNANPGTYCWRAIVFVGFLL